MARAGHDYVAAKALYIRGLNLKQISDKMSIPYDALFKFCKRNGWDIERTKNTQILTNQVQDQLSAQASKHLSKITGLTDRAIDALLTKDVVTMDLDALETLGKVADTFDRIARRSFGLDGESGKTVLNMAVNVQPPQSSTPLSSMVKVIDVEPVDPGEAKQVVYKP